jgi:thiamine-phosphate pyrophosphorylase
MNVFLNFNQLMNFSDPTRTVRSSDTAALQAQLRGLYVITDEAMGGGHLTIARAALQGGARIIQLRDKSTPPRPLLAIANELRRLTREAGALLFINDRIDLALLCEADGVHLGPDDFPLAEVRRAVGHTLLLGASCGTPEEAVLAQREGADMIGIGAVYGTATKHDAGEAIGIEGLKRVMEATTLPAAAIGGINHNNIAPVVETGVPMVCAISAVAGAGGVAQMEAATRALVAVLDKGSR